VPSFFEKLDRAMTRNRSLLCVGLDPDPSKLPAGAGLLDFNRSIIEATAHAVCAYKPNLAFYEALGVEGWHLLKETIACIPEDIPVIADAKRGDIGNTARAYAQAIFEQLECDAVTVSPYLGLDSLEPFIAYREKGIFILCRTSNTGAADFQDLAVKSDGHELPLYQLVARRASEWNIHGNVGLVVGGTCPAELGTIRRNHPAMTLLVPGVGAQGGKLDSILAAGMDRDRKGLIINVSRQILYASTGSDYARVASETAEKITREINDIRDDVEQV